MSKMINVGISDLNIAKAPDVLVTYALGSCVGICLLDKNNDIGGLAHIMLPYSKEAGDTVSTNLRRYADTGIVELIQMMVRNGAVLANIIAKIAGGAQMFQTQINTFNIGERNVEAVKKVLSANRIKIVAEDTGQNFGRTVFFDVKTGEMKVKTASSRLIVL
ncbi:MAG: chemotaxis protein CheD [Clostridiales bacterium]|jgi:chemotaxis protein CheD|nr:chemotaxis protein CheD [Clostridiales bacterium]